MTKDNKLTVLAVVLSISWLLFCGHEIDDAVRLAFAVLWAVMFAFSTVILLGICVMFQFTSEEDKRGHNLV